LLLRFKLLLLGLGQHDLLLELLVVMMMVVVMMVVMILHDLVLT
jgi:hypothetical protein